MSCFCLPLSISKQLSVSEIAANACYDRAENTIDTDKLKGNSIQKRICEKQRMRKCQLVTKWFL